MADPFSIVGLISVIVQVVQLGAQFRSDWKEAPSTARSFLAELATLKTVLSELHANVLLNDDVKDAFQNRPSTIISELGPSAQATATKDMVAACKSKLEELLDDFKQRSQGHRFGWERLKGAFAAQDTRDAIENLQRRCQLLNSMVSIDILALNANVYKEVKSSRAEQENERETARRHKILEWLTPVNYALQQNDFLSRHQPGTGRWLLDSPEFQAWRSTEIRTLFCPGTPGTGKTILASVIVDDLINRFHADKSIGVAYLYCNFRRQEEQTVAKLLTNLLKQLVEKQPSLPGDITALYDKHQEKKSRPLTTEVIHTLQSVVRQYERVYIVVDAVDECQDSQNSRSDLLREIFRLQANCGINFLATSRFIPEIMQSFRDHPDTSFLEIKAHSGDVGQFLDAHLDHLPVLQGTNAKLRIEIKEAILEAVDGMFLLAYIYLDSLRDKITPRAVKKALLSFHKQTPNASESQWQKVLDRAYTDAMDRIRGQEKGFRELAERVLFWIICAMRPLKTSELQHALAVEIGDTELDMDGIVDTDRMVSVTAGLVTVDKESNIIRLVHYTTQEYFDQTRIQWFPNAHVEITKICITYLSFNIFDGQTWERWTGFDDRKRSSAFYHYASKYWANHARHASVFIQEVHDFLCSREKIPWSNKALCDEASTNEHFHPWAVAPHNMPALHVAAYLGLLESTSVLLLTQHLDLKDDYKRTPLTWAILGRQEPLVKLLLDKGASVDTQDKDGQTPLFYASYEGGEGILRLLLSHSTAQIGVTTRRGKTALIVAAGWGHEAAVKLLLDHHAAVNVRDFDGNTALIEAAWRGHTAIVKLLLNHHAAVDARNSDGNTALMEAVAEGHEAVVHLLLDHDADIDVRYSNDNTPLIEAAYRGYTAIVKLLLNYDADVEARNSGGNTALMEAVIEGYEAEVEGHEAVVHLLLDRHAAVDVRYSNGDTLLMEAIAWGREAIVKRLLNHDAAINGYRGMGYTPLIKAAQCGRHAVCKLLLDYGAAIDLPSPGGATPLSYAAEGGEGQIVALLLSRGADVDFCNPHGHTPLRLAVQQGHVDVVKLLLVGGADVNRPDQLGRTPLMLATDAGNEALVKLLLDGGAAVDVEDDFGRALLIVAANDGNERRLLMKTLPFTGDWNVAKS